MPLAPNPPPAAPSPLRGSPMRQSGGPAVSTVGSGQPSNITNTEHAPASRRTPRTPASGLNSAPPNSAALQETPNGRDDSSESSPPSARRDVQNLQKEIKDLREAVEGLQFHNTRLRGQRDKALNELEKQKSRAAQEAQPAQEPPSAPIKKQFAPISPCYETFDALFRRVEGWAYAYARIPWNTLDLDCPETQTLIEICKKLICDRNFAILNGPNKYLLVAAIINLEVVKTLGEHCLNEYVSEFSNEMAIIESKLDVRNDNDPRTSFNDRRRALNRRTAIYNRIFANPAVHEFMEEWSEKYVETLMGKLHILIAPNLRHEAKTDLLSIMQMGFRLGMGMLTQARTWRFAWAARSTRWQPRYSKYRDWSQMDNEESKDASDHFVLLGVAPEIMEKAYPEGAKASDNNILHWKVALLYHAPQRPHPLPQKPTPQPYRPNASFPL
ncbi:MAG: hypothetical protein M1831_002065 [Alyxoria varia]|nr:MAG: hypothetical protein M1831_002065 [Alyxoria varia]